MKPENVHHGCAGEAGEAAKEDARQAMIAVAARRRASPTPPSWPRSTV